MADWSALPLNFPQDFLPDRDLIARLLAFAADGGAGTMVEIGTATGIPTGKSTGKVEPMIHYARGMGLIAAEKASGRWSLAPSALGALVLQQDRFLDEPVTLWAAHLLLCRPLPGSDPPRGIADPWFALFADGPMRLGRVFDRDSFHAFLAERHGTLGYLRPLSGLVPRSYTETACLGALGVLTAEGADRWRRHLAPTRRELFPAYSLALFLAWDRLAPDQAQLDLAHLLAQARLLDCLGWTSDAAEPWLGWMVEQGLLRLDRLTGGTVALRMAETPTSIEGLYDELT
jgi:hypothetical protein